MDDERFRRRARVLRNLVGLVFAGLLLLVVVILASALAHAAAWRDLATPLLYQVPILLYLWAIWMVRDALARFARGAIFDAVVPRMLARTGWALATGALLNVIGAPLVAIALRLRHAGPLLMFNPAAITLGVLGFALVVFARLSVEATAMRRELDEMF